MGWWWCDLDLNKTTSGPGNDILRPWATYMYVLCMSLKSFWHFFQKLKLTDRQTDRWMQGFLNTLYPPNFVLMGWGKITDLYNRWDGKKVFYANLTRGNGMLDISELLKNPCQNSGHILLCCPPYNFTLL